MAGGNLTVTMATTSGSAVEEKKNLHKEIIFIRSFVHSFIRLCRVRAKDDSTSKLSLTAQGEREMEIE